MAKILAVFGATGQQGSSVVNNVLSDPELSKQYQIRAITRDVNSEKSKQLKEKVEVVQGDVSDRASLETALAGVHTVFSMTVPTFGPDAIELEYNAAKLIADVAVEKGAEYIIFSSLPNITKVSGGKYTKVTPFDAKAKAEDYIRSLPIKSAFFVGGFFMENIHSQPLWTPRKGSDGTWAITHHNKPETPIPFIDATSDTGKFVGAILAEPDKYQGKTFYGAQALYTMAEFATAMGKATGTNVVYKQVPVEDYKNSLPFPAGLVDVFIEGFSSGEEFGYFGTDDEQKAVAWSVENARGKLTSLDEYLKTNPVQLA